MIDNVKIQKIRVFIRWGYLLEEDELLECEPPECEPLECEPPLLLPPEREEEEPL
jgi:hypothetical protein